MYEQINKPKDNKSSAVLNKVCQKQRKRESFFAFVDYPTNANLQRGQKNMINNSSQVNQLMKTHYSSVIQRLEIEHHALNDAPQPDQRFPNCFMAVLTWLQSAERNLVNPNTILDNIMDKGGPGPLMQRILQLATKLTRPGLDNNQLRLTPGRIIIFAQSGSPTHAAISTGALQITGYNQTNWFGQPANKHSHSSIEGVLWVSADTITNFAGAEETVHEVNPSVAVSVFD